MKFLEVLRLFRAAAAECLWTAAALGLGRLLDIGWYGRLGKANYRILLKQFVTLIRSAPGSSLVHP